VVFVSRCSSSASLSASLNFFSLLLTISRLFSLSSESYSSSPSPSTSTSPSAASSAWRTRRGDVGGREERDYGNFVSEQTFRVRLTSAGSPGVFFFFFLESKARIMNDDGGESPDHVVIEESIIVHTCLPLERSSAWGHPSEGRGCFCFFPSASSQKHKRWEATEFVFTHYAVKKKFFFQCRLLKLPFHFNRRHIQTRMGTR